MGVYLGRGDGGAVAEVRGPGVGGFGEGGATHEQAQEDDQRQEERTHGCSRTGVKASGPSTIQPLGLVRLP